MNNSLIRIHLALSFVRFDELNLIEIMYVCCSSNTSFLRFFYLSFHYFTHRTINYRNTTTTTTNKTNKITGKEVLGIRMFLFACITGQIALMLASNFKSPVASQLIENVPFYHAMARIVIAEQGYGSEALSTLFFLFGLSSIVTGLIFYGLGKAGLGKAVYYFPNHVLVGFIGGIGVFIGCSSTGVMIGEDFTFTADGVRSLYDNFNEFAPVVIFEVVLRILMTVLKDKNGKPKFTLLAPVFFISIIPIYYFALYIFGVSMEQATTAGYFFPSSTEDDGSGVTPSFVDTVFDGHIMDLFRIVDFKTISWTAVINALGTVIGVSCFSVINVPINIPAFANTCDVEVDMNNELMSHGYSNILTGIFGGIQNVMTYSVSVLYYKSGGKSRAGQMALIIGTIFIFVFGTFTMPYIPRCMAGTLLLHIGIDLFMEGVYDSYEEYDSIEYGGVSSTSTCTFLFLFYFAGDFICCDLYFEFF
jgi:SulP family sulfate permease